MANSNKYIIPGVGVQVIQRSIYKSGVDAVMIKQAQAGGRDKPLYKSSLGTDVYGDFTVDPFNYTIDGVTYFVPGVKIYSMVMAVAKAKFIVKTSIQGLRGNVNEYISSGDDSIIITGKILGSNGKYPYNEVSDLNKLIEAPVAFKATSKWLQNLNINTIVIEQSEMPQMPGGYSYQDFTLYCTSDIPIELNIVSSSNTTAQ